MTSTLVTATTAATGGHPTVNSDGAARNITTPTRPGIPEWAASSLRRAYPHGYAGLEKAIADSSAEADLPNVADVEVHADRVRLSCHRGDVVAEVPFDVSGAAPHGGVPDFVLDHDRQAVFLFSDRDERGVAAPAWRQRLFDLLRPGYWLVEGAAEPGCALLPGVPGIGELLAGVLGREDVRAIHPWVRVAADAMSREPGTGGAEFAQNLHRASVELRRSGLDPELQRALDGAARTATRLRRGVQPVLAIRRTSRQAVLRGLDADDVDSLRATFADPAVSGRLAAAHPVDPAFVADASAADLLALVDDLRECEFFTIFLMDRIAPADGGATRSPAGVDHAPEAILITPGSLRETTTLVRSLSRANAFLFSREQSRRMIGTTREGLIGIDRGRQVVGFFPGLGSRSFYRDLGRGLLDSGIPEVVDVYEQGARALGLPGPEALLLVPGNVPGDRLAAQGFIGAAFLAHGLALDTHLRVTAANAGVPLRIAGYTGESFGIITAAVAAGALSVADGTRLAHAFTPLLLTAADGAGDDSPAAEPAAYLPESLRGRPLVTEPHHVVGLRGEPAALAALLAAVARTFPTSDVEVHKLYSHRQTNVYVRAGAKDAFDRFAGGFPAVAVEELKPPTTFLAHAERMTAARHAFERFMTDQGVVFRKPHAPVVSNNNSGLLTTAAEVRNGVLAIVDEVMASRATAETLDALRPDAIVELGLGGKSVRLLVDNDLDVPVTSYTGTAGDADPFLRAVRLTDTLLGQLADLRTGAGRITDRHHDALRDVFRAAGEDRFCERYLYRTIGRVVADEAARHDRSAPPAFHELLETLQHTCNYRDHVDVEAGELVLQARLRKRIVGAAEDLGQVYAELKVLDAAGVVGNRSLTRVEQHEVVVVHFDHLPGLDYADLAANTRLLLDTQPLARQIYDQVFDSLGVADDGFLTLPGVTTPTVDQLALGYLVYQYTLFRLLRLHRPAAFLHDHYLAGSDPMGWLVALAASGAAALPDVVRLYAAYLRSGTGTEEAQAALDRVLASLRTPEVPVLSSAGTPLQAKIDLEATTRVVFA
ncbi:malonyl CoA-acyl carrier protein transacylase [Saccharothrix texasensis]|uniref:Malonyl CoA-acyl carrier protein transacylase n=1 Tax=Saccharothrix texasensis TaxID=103734 RepID=A0A3N1GXS1_9PSEU|nr:malonyl CoA-acyl carrier protein transacylase [Saccharothrix texasensis]